MSVSLWRCARTYVLVNLAMMAVPVLGVPLPSSGRTFVATIMACFLEANRLADYYETLMPKGRAWREAFKISALFGAIGLVAVFVLVPLGAMGGGMSFPLLLLTLGVALLMMIPQVLVIRFFLRFFMKQRLKSKGIAFQ